MTSDLNIKNAREIMREKPVISTVRSVYLTSGIEIESALFDKCFGFSIWLGWLNSAVNPVIYYTNREVLLILPTGFYPIKVMIKDISIRRKRGVLRMYSDS